MRSAEKPTRPENPQRHQDLPHQRVTAKMQRHSQTFLRTLGIEWNRSISGPAVSCARDTIETPEPQAPIARRRDT